MLLSSAMMQIGTHVSTLCKICISLHKLWEHAHQKNMFARTLLSTSCMWSYTRSFPRASKKFPIQICIRFYTTPSKDLSRVINTEMYNQAQIACSKKFSTILALISSGKLVNSRNLMIVSFWSEIYFPSSFWTSSASSVPAL